MNDPPMTILNEKFNEIATNATIFTLKSVTELSAGIQIEPVPDSGIFFTVTAVEMI